MQPAEARLQPLGIVWIAWSVLTGVLGLGVMAFFLGAGSLITLLPDASSGEPAPWWVGALFGGLGLVVGGVLAAMGAFGVAVGIGLRQGRTWAMIGACVLALLHLTNFPFGTILAVWTLWAVLSVYGERKQR